MQRTLTQNLDNNSEFPTPYKHHSYGHVPLLEQYIPPEYILLSSIKESTNSFNHLTFIYVEQFVRNI